MTIRPVTFTQSIGNVLLFENIPSDLSSGTDSWSCSFALIKGPKAHLVDVSYDHVLYPESKNWRWVLRLLEDLQRFEGVGRIWLS
jgi:hypothetical protein